MSKDIVIDNLTLADLPASWRDRIGDTLTGSLRVTIQGRPRAYKNIKSKARELIDSIEPIDVGGEDSVEILRRLRQERLEQLTSDNPS